MNQNPERKHSGLLKLIKHSNLWNRSIKISQSSKTYCVFICELLFLFGVLLGSSSAESLLPVNGKTSLIIDIRMPAGVQSEKADEYFCMSTSIRNLSKKDALYIEGFDYNFNKSQIHHFLLYGCKTMTQHFVETDYWPCNGKKKGIVCEGRKQIPLGLPSSSVAADNSNSSKTARFPLNVAYGIGPKFGINYLLLEMHYVGGMMKNKGDHLSGVKLHITDKKPKYYGGMLTMTAVGFSIPPKREKYSVNINCQPTISDKIMPYAYWVHTHELGKVVSGYKVDKQTGTFTEIARWSHHLPQPVVLTSEGSDNYTAISIQPGDFLAARCTYNSSKVNSTVRWGSRRKQDEMCNLFIFYYTLSANPNDLSLSCVNELSREITNNIPQNSDILSEQPEQQQQNNDNVKPRDSKSESPICNLYRKFRIKNCPYE